MLRVLVTGAGGLLGGRLAVAMAREASVVGGIHHAAAPKGVETVTFDLLDPAAVAAALDTTRAEAVVHSAAFADADLCERDPATAQRVNVDASVALARLCREREIRLVHISTDLVLGGDRPFSSERDPAAPVMVYGRSKLASEEAVLTECPGSAVVRCALVHGRGHGRRATASESIAWAVAAGRTPRLFLDQWRTPIDAESVASALLRLVHGDEEGVFHLGGPERVSRYELGMRTAQALGLPGTVVEAVTQADVPMSAPRPVDVSMDTTRARLELGWQPRSLRESIAEGRPGPG